jgi:hypothetical protein
MNIAEAEMAEADRAGQVADSRSRQVTLALEGHANDEVRRPICPNSRSQADLRTHKWGKVTTRTAVVLYGSWRNRARIRPSEDDADDER